MHSSITDIVFLKLRLFLSNLNAFLEASEYSMCFPCFIDCFNVCLHDFIFLPKSLPTSFGYVCADHLIREPSRREFESLNQLKHKIYMYVFPMFWGMNDIYGKSAIIMTILWLFCAFPIRQLRREVLLLSLVRSMLILWSLIGYENKLHDILDLLISSYPPRYNNVLFTDEYSRTYFFNRPIFQLHSFHLV